MERLRSRKLSTLIEFHFLKIIWEKWKVQSHLVLICSSLIILFESSSNLTRNEEISFWPEARKIETYTTKISIYLYSKLFRFVFILFTFFFPIKVIWNWECSHKAWLWSQKQTIEWMVKSDGKWISNRNRMKWYKLWRTLRKKEKRNKYHENGQKLSSHEKHDNSFIIAL